MSQRIHAKEASIVFTYNVKKHLYWCADCSNLSECELRHWERQVCKRGRGDRGITTCYGLLRELRGEQTLVDAILAAYAVGGWDAGVAIWIEAGTPRL